MTITYSIPTVRDAWADTAVPTADIVDPGNAYVAAGWLSSTTPPPRQYFNWVLNWVGNAVRYFMQNGICDWQAGELYQQGAVVVWNNFVYQSSINSNTANQPDSSPSAWGPLTGYATLSNLLAYVTTAQLNAALVPYAALNSPTLTGAPLAPTLPAGTSNGGIATTAFVQTALTNNLSSYLTIAAAASTYLTTAAAASTYATQGALSNAVSGFGSGRLPATIYRGTLGSGNVTVQSGGAPSGGSSGDMFLIY